MRFVKSIAFILIFLTLSLSQNTFDVLYDSDADIGGFQFSVTGIEGNLAANAASGGAASENGFTTSAGGTTVLGFSFSGGVIPAGSGILTTVDVGDNDPSLACVDGLVVSDPSGVALDFNLDCVSFVIGGCEDVDVDGICDDIDDCVGSYDDCGVCNGSGASQECWDGSLVCDEVDCPTQSSSLDILYDSDSPIAGFQFNVEGVEVTGASGGDAAANGFTVSASSTTVLGFSLTGSTIAAGSGVLTVLEVTGDSSDVSLSGVVISNPSGQAYEVVVDGLTITIDAIDDNVYGCTDESACNYNGDATADDDSCEYAEENFDCDGNCTTDIDCADVCGGSSVEDECGVCDGSGASECWDGSFVCDETDCPDVPTLTVEIGYESPFIPIGGFQFGITDGSIVSASGGDAIANGFTVSTSSTVVIGFSLTGSTIAAGSGTLISLEIEGTDSSCITDLVLSDASGTAIDYDLDCASFTTIQVVEGCTDEAACNYDELANTDDDSCEYAEENFDCDGNCTTDIDCADVCGGSSVEDECGVCDGSGASECWDGSFVCDETDCPDVPTLTVEIGYESPFIPIGGFQFGITDGSIVSASGGDAIANGFTVSTSPTVVIGFSLTGSTIPAGDGILVTLEIQSTGNPCITDLVLSDPSGVAIDYELGCDAFVTIPPGCTDSSACNYDEYALSDDGSCEYAEENFDCDGNCTAEVDCAGECAGSAVEDCAGVCNGTSIEVTFCEDTDGDGYGNPGTETVECVDSGRDEITGGCDLPDNNLFLSEEGSVYYSSSEDIGGFQFNIDGAVPTGASGGDAATAGFTVSTGGSIALGFSLTGSTIPAGCGTLVELDLDGEATGLSGIVISDAVGQAIPFEYYYDTDGMDMVADCSDEYPDCTSNIVDCAGDCDGSAEEDCQGDCNGDAIVDECGVCGGDNTTCLDDCGVVNGDDTSCSVSLSFGNVNSDLMEILIETGTADVGGFQFNVDGVTLNAAGGGLAADNGFTVQTGGATVIGFSLSGSVIAANSNGVLTELVYSPNTTEACLSSAVIAGSDASALPVIVGDCIAIDYSNPGCTDESACNYDSSATEDDDSCTYAEENFDCDGNCTVETDCNGDCGGDSIVDECGVCDGDNACLVTLSFGAVTFDNLEIVVETPSDIGGFQFDLTSDAGNQFIVGGASGGLAADNGFTVSTGNNIVIGFSLTGSTIAAGSAGVLTNLAYVCDYEYEATACIENIVVSDATGGALQSQFTGGCVTVGNLECDDLDVDGICDDVDDCIGEYDECGVCNGDGIADGACDCDGNIEDECGVCGGPGSEENYDCDGNCTAEVDCAGECAGSAVEDECGVCNGDGIADGACDCDGNVADCAGECGGSALEDNCGVCNGDDSSCSGCIDETANNYDSEATIDDESCNFDHYYVDIANTGINEPFIFTNSISVLDEGDEIGVFDANAQLSFGNCDSQIGELLVGSGTWSGDQIEIVAIGSFDSCDFGGYLLPGWVEGNDVIIRVWDASAQVEYDVNATYTAGGNEFGDFFNTIVALEFIVPGCTDIAACNYDSEANTNDGSCEYAEQNYDCDGECTADSDCNGSCGGDAIVDDCGECVDPDDACASELTNTIPLSESWNWISFNVKNDDMGLTNVFSSIAQPNDGIDNITFIKSQLEGTATWYETFGWFGDLTSSGIKNEQMYQVKLDNSAVLTLSGAPVNASDTPIELAESWNWIGYIPQVSYSVGTAFGNLAIANDGIDNVNFIKSQLDGTATWYETFGWFGDLETAGMEPTKGYQIKMNNPAVLYYPGDDLAVVSSDENQISNELARNNMQDLLGWNFNPRDYEFNGTITFAVNNFDDNEGDLLAAFVGDELRGLAECVYFPFGDTYIYIMQVYSNEVNGEKLTFELYDIETGQIHKYTESVVFENDMIIGDGFATFNLSDTESDMVIPVVSSLGYAYPNPFNPTTSLDYSLANDTHVSIAVYDVSGQVVESLVDGYKNAGNYNVVWDAHNYSSGIYFIGMNVNGDYYTQKLMLVK